MDAVAPRAIPVGDTRNIRDLNDIARAAENAVGERSSCPRRSGIVRHRKARVPLLTGDVVVLPILLQLRVLLFSALLDPESVDHEHDNHHKRDPADHTPSDCAYIGPTRCRRWIGVCNAGHARATRTVLRLQHANLVARACRAGRHVGRTLHAAFEDGPEVALDICCLVSADRRGVWSNAVSLEDMAPRAVVAIVMPDSTC